MHILLYTDHSHMPMGLPPETPAHDNILHNNDWHVMLSKC